MREGGKKGSSEGRFLGLFTILVFGFVFFSIVAYYQGFSITGFAIENYYDGNTMYVLNAYEGDAVRFVLPVTNTNTSFIQRAYATITIFNKDLENSVVLQTNNLTLGSGDKKELLAIWDKAGEAGTYTAQVLMIFDDESYSFTKEFTIDKKIITFESILVNEFNLGDVANFSILVKNHLESDIENVSAGILIYDDSNNVISEIRSARTTIHAGQTEALAASWDTKTIQEGTYNAQLVVSYGTTSITKDIVLKVTPDGLDVIGVGYAIAKRPAARASSNTLLIFVIGLLVLVNITWIIIYRRKVHSREQTQ